MLLQNVRERKAKERGEGLREKGEVEARRERTREIYHDRAR